MSCRFFIDGATYNGSDGGVRKRMVSRMSQMCPGMPFSWTVVCDPVPDSVVNSTPGSPPWRFTFQVIFEVTNAEQNPLPPPV